MQGGFGMCDEMEKALDSSHAPFTCPFMIKGQVAQELSVLVVSSTTEGS